MPRRSHVDYLIDQPPRRRPLFWAGRFAFAASSLALCFLAWTTWALHAEHAPTLNRLANFLWLKQEPLPADLICVLGGDYLQRVPLAADLHHEGLAPKILLPRENMGWPSQAALQTAEKNQQEHFTDASLRLLRQANVPDTAIEDWNVRGGVRSTADELRALAIYLNLFPEVRRVLIITSHYHTRRVHYAAGRILPSRVDYRVVGAPVSGWKLEYWWLHPVARKTIQDEYLKLIYYIPRYFLG